MPSIKERIAALNLAQGPPRANRSAPGLSRASTLPLTPPITPPSPHEALPSSQLSNFGPKSGDSAAPRGSVRDRLPKNFVIPNLGVSYPPSGQRSWPQSLPVLSPKMSTTDSGDRRWGAPALSRPSLPAGRELPARAKRRGYSRKWALQKMKLEPLVAPVYTANDESYNEN